MKLLVYQDWVIWLIVRRWYWDFDMAEALVADTMGLGKTFTMVTVAMIFTLLTSVSLV
jgi:hypothetical protein